MRAEFSCVVTPLPGATFKPPVGSPCCCGFHTGFNEKEGTSKLGRNCRYHCEKSRKNTQEIQDQV